MPTIAGMDGMEHGQSSVAGSGLYANITGSAFAAFSGTAAHSGDLGLLLTGHATNNKYYVYAVSGTMIVGSLYFRWPSTVPTGQVEYCEVRSNNGGTIRYCSFGIDSTDHPYVAWYNGGEISRSTSTMTVVADQWYRLDFRIDVDTASAWNVDWGIGVGDLPSTPETSLPYTGVAAAGAFDEYRVGAITAMGTGQSTHIDDAAWSFTEADYPLGPYKITGADPNADGTHSVGSGATVYWKMSGGTLVGISNSETLAYQEVDDFGGTLDSNYIRVVKGGALANPVAGTASATDGSVVTPTLPSGLTPGDLMMAVFYCREVTDGTVSISTSGWASQHNSRSATGGILAIWTKTYEAGDAAPTFSHTGIATGTTGDSAIAHIARIPGGFSVVEVGTRGNFASAQNIGAITGITIGANCMVLVVAGKRDDWTSVATLSGDSLTWNEIGEPDTTSGADAGLVWDNAIAGGSGATVTSKTFTVTGGASAASAGIMVEVDPKRTLDGTEYLEFAFPNSTETVDPWAVRGIVALRNEEGTTANSITAKLRANSNESNIFSGDIGSASVIFKSGVFATAPGGAAWTIALWDGATMRWGYTTDADSAPRLDAAMYEVIYPIQSYVPRHPAANHQNPALV